MASAGLGCLLYRWVSVIHELPNCLCPDRHHDQANGHFLFPSTQRPSGETPQSTVSDIRAILLFGLFAKLLQLIPREMARKVQTAGNVKAISKRPADGYPNAQRCHATFVTQLLRPVIRKKGNRRLSRGNIHSSSLCGSGAREPEQRGTL